MRAVAFSLAVGLVLADSSGAWSRGPLPGCTRSNEAALGGYIGLDTWRTREWYDALDAAGIDRRGPYHLRHTFATEALAAGISTWELARLMGTSVAMIDRTYGHLARDAEESIRARLDARAAQPGVDLASQ